MGFVVDKMALAKDFFQTLEFSPANYHHPPMLHTHLSSGSGITGPFGGHSTTELVSPHSLQVQKNGETNMSFIHRWYFYSKLFIPADWAPY